MRHNDSVLPDLFLQVFFVLPIATTSKIVIKIHVHLKCIQQLPVRCRDPSSETTPLKFLHFLLSFQLALKATSSGLQISRTAPVPVTTAWEFAHSKQKCEGRMTKYLRPVCVRTQDMTGLSIDPHSMVPGRDYPMTQLSALMS